jgi:hypothetical protein
VARSAEARLNPEVSLVIPLRDEELNVVPLHEELTRVLETLGTPYEIILIDDGARTGRSRSCARCSRAIRACA